MTVLQALRDYFQAYPGLNGERLDMDCLAREVDHYSIDSVPVEPVIKTYLDGSTVRQFLFTLSSRVYYGQDLKQQAGNLEFFDGLEGWLGGKLFFEILPVLGAGRKARKLEVTSSAYPYIINESGTARYQTQLRLEYLQEAKL